MSQAGDPQTKRSRSLSHHAKTPNTRDLSPEQRQLLVLLHGIDYASVFDLVVRGGQPVLDPLPRIMREVTLKPASGTRPRPIPEDFALREQVIELLRQMAEIGDGLIRRLEVKGGLPFRYYIEGPSQFIVRMFPQYEKDGMP